MNSIKETDLYKRVINKSNIYSAIYCVESYVFEKGLLSESDIKMLNALSDKFNFSYIEKVMQSCERLLEKIFTTDEYFKISVFFKLKKYDSEKESVEYRPLHTTDLITQICIVCMLNIIMFDDSARNKRKLSDISKLLPSNFYGNIPSTNVEDLFVNWKMKYKEYSEAFIGAYKSYSETRKYKYEITLDLVRFFPSINPNIVYNLVLEKLSTIYLNNEMKCLEILVKKLLYFKMVDIEDYAEIYYKDSIKSPELIENIVKSKLFFSVGIPQGLPQSYFFANLCMIDIAKLFDQTFNGDSYFYVDDSVIYANDIDGQDRLINIFPNMLTNINIELRERYSNNQHIFPSDIASFEELIDYKIKIHTTGKSTISEIADKKYGQGYLDFVTRQTSTVPFEIATSTDELEDATVRDKIAVFQEAIEKEIRYVKILAQLELDPSNTKYDNYLKLLKRYQKFFKYRLLVMDLREDNQIKITDIENFYGKYYININGELIYINRQNS